MASATSGGGQLPPPDPSATPKPPKSFIDAINTSLSSSASIPVKPLSSHCGEPAVYFSKDEIDVMAKPFKLSLIGKFSFGRPPMDIIREFLASLGLKGNSQASLLDQRHVLINLSLEEDYTRLWLRQSWYIKGRSMRMFKWTTSFRCSEESPIVPIWISLPFLPIHFVNCKQALYSIAAAVGKPLRVDHATAASKRPSVARVLVEYDISQVLLPRVWIGEGDEGFWQDIIFEKVPLYCHSCKHLGHDPQSCYITKPELRVPWRNNKADQVPNKAEQGKPDSGKSILKNDHQNQARIQVQPDTAPRDAPAEGSQENQENDALIDGVEGHVAFVSSHGDLHLDSIPHAIPGPSHANMGSCEKLTKAVDPMAIVASTRSPPHDLTSFVGVNGVHVKKVSVQAAHVSLMVSEHVGDDSRTPIDQSTAGHSEDLQPACCEDLSLAVATIGDVGVMAQGLSEIQEKVGGPPLFTRASQPTLERRAQPSPTKACAASNVDNNQTPMDEDDTASNGDKSGKNTNSPSPSAMPDVGLDDLAIGLQKLHSQPTQENVQRPSQALSQPTFQSNMAQHSTAQGDIGHGLEFNLGQQPNFHPNHEKSLDSVQVAKAPIVASGPPGLHGPSEPCSRESTSSVSKSFSFQAGQRIEFNPNPTVVVVDSLPMPRPIYISEDYITDGTVDEADSFYMPDYSHVSFNTHSSIIPDDTYYGTISRSHSLDDRNFCDEEIRFDARCGVSDSAIDKRINTDADGFTKVTPRKSRQYHLRPRNRRR